MDCRGEQDPRSRGIGHRSQQEEQNQQELENDRSPSLEGTLDGERPHTPDSPRAYHHGPAVAMLTATEQIHQPLREPRWQSPALFPTHELGRGKVASSEPMGGAVRRWQWRGWEGALVTTPHSPWPAVSTQHTGQKSDYVSLRESLARPQAPVCPGQLVARVERARGPEGEGTYQVTHEWDGLPLADVRHAVDDDEATSRAVRHTQGRQGPRKSPFLQQTSPEAGAGRAISQV